MAVEHECMIAGAGDGEYCREYCLNYGTDRCRYDPETRKMMVKDGEDE